MRRVVEWSPCSRESLTPGSFRSLHRGRKRIAGSIRINRDSVAELMIDVRDLVMGCFLGRIDLPISIGPRSP